MRGSAHQVPPQKGANGNEMSSTTMNRDTALDILGLNAAEAEDPATVKAAYRNLSKEAHPDAGGSATFFRLVTQAYEVLAGEQPIEGQTFEEEFEYTSYSGWSRRRQDPNAWKAKLSQEEAIAQMRHQSTYGAGTSDRSHGKARRAMQAVTDRIPRLSLNASVVKEAGSGVANASGQFPAVANAIGAVVIVVAFAAIPGTRMVFPWTEPTFLNAFIAGAIAAAILLFAIDRPLRRAPVGVRIPVALGLLALLFVTQAALFLAIWLVLPGIAVYLFVRWLWF